MYEWGANSWDFPEDNVDGSIKVLLAPRADVDSIEPMESPDIRYDYIIFSPKSPGSARNFLSWSPPAPTSSSGEYVERVEAGDGWWPGVDPRGNAGFIPCEYYESAACNVIQSSELAGTISIHASCPPHVVQPVVANVNLSFSPSRIQVVALRYNFQDSHTETELGIA